MLPKIIVISNQSVNQNELKSFLTKEGFEVLLFSEITKNTLELISNVSPDIILIEMDKDGHDGIDLCHQLKMENKITAFIVINSSFPEEYIQIEAFKAGADDYYIVPISNRLLIKKIRALLKHSSFSNSTHSSTLISYKDLVIDKESYAILRGSEQLTLPKKEFELLCLFFKNPQKIFSRNEIYRNIWDNAENYNPRIIDVHIRKIREKIGDTVIKTIKGVGYQLAN